MLTGIGSWTSPSLRKTSRPRNLHCARGWSPLGGSGLTACLYSPKCPEEAFCELRFDGVLGSCASPSNTSHLTSLCNTAGLITPVALQEEYSLWRDRKSTRLNSSHANISYAVFCLKKKKKK